MTTCCSGSCAAIEKKLDEAMARRELASYLKKGPGPTTKLLRDGIVAAGVSVDTLLDVGAGIGALTFELLERSVRRAVGVDASAASVAAAKAEDPWKAIRFLTGEWVGESEGESTYPPQPKNPKGEVHEHWSFFSHDRARRTLILRQFHQEGFVNQFVFAPPNAAGTLVFESEALENVPAGWKARET